MIEHRPPTQATVRHILAACGNSCAYPACPRVIFDLNSQTLLGTTAHIKSRSERGPRFDPMQAEEENRSASNLIAMCAEHSKIIDGPSWRNYSVETLAQWKRDLEERVARNQDRSWIRPPAQLTKLVGGPNGGVAFRLCYWIDTSGRPRAFSKQQLAAINVLMTLNLELNKVATLPDRLADAEGSDVRTVRQQSWARFKPETSVLADLLTRMAMVPNITFAEFLAFIVKGNEATSLIQHAAARITALASGAPDPLVTTFYRSDQDTDLNTLGTNAVAPK